MTHRSDEDRAQVLWVFAALGALLVCVSAARLWIGSASVGWPSGDLSQLILEARIARLGIACTVGVALAISGVALQALLRNPLAEPYILGLSTGAGAGVMAQAWLLYTLGYALGPGYLGAVLGAAGSMAIVFFAGRRRGIIDPVGLLLTGVVLGTINGALIMLFNYAIGPGGLRDDLSRWMMGYINENDSRAVLFTLASMRITLLHAVATVTAGGLAVLLKMAPAMDIATLSEGEAISLGVHVPRMRMALFLVASVLAAGAVVLTGPVAFVGLISPHVARVVLGPRHGALLAASAFIGAALIVTADVCSSLIAYRFDTGLIPIGVFTAMIGGPAFLWMLRPQLGRGME